MPKAAAPEVRPESPDAPNPPTTELRTAEALVRGTLSVFSELEQRIRPHGDATLIEAFDAFLRCRDVLLGRLANAAATRERILHSCVVCRGAVSVGDSYLLVEPGNLVHSACHEADGLAVAGARS